MNEPKPVKRTILEAAARDEYGEITFKKLADKYPDWLNEVETLMLIGIAVNEELIPKQFPMEGWNKFDYESAFLGMYNQYRRLKKE